MIFLEKGFEIFEPKGAQNKVKMNFSSFLSARSFSEFVYEVTTA